MSFQSVEITGVGESDPIMINCNVNPVSVGYCTVVDGQVDYDVQYCFDDERLGLENWFTHFNGFTDSEWGNINFPVTAIRVLVNSGSGSVKLQVIQAV